MRTKTLFSIFGFLIAFALLGSQTLAAQEYVVMGTPLVNIRTGPTTASMVVARASKGDVFQVLGEENGWYKIKMFSPDPRYIVKAEYIHLLVGDSLAAGHDMLLPTSTARVRSIFWDTEAGLDRAAREATEIIPVTLNRDRHTYLKHILEDRILLEMFHIHGVRPAVYGELLAEARAERWN